MPTPNNSPNRRDLGKMRELAKKKERLERSYRRPPAPPKPPKPPGGGSAWGKFGGKAFNAAAKLSLVLTGIQLGNWASRKATGTDGGPSSWGADPTVSDYQEQQAIREFEAMRERDRREIQPAVFPFKGGQVQGALYTVTCSMTVINIYDGSKRVIPCSPQITQGKITGIEKRYPIQGGYMLIGIINSSNNFSSLDGLGISSNERPYDARILSISRYDGTSLENDINQGGNPVAITNSITNNYPITIVNYPPPVPFNDGELRFQLTKHIGELNNKLSNEFNLNFREMRERLINLSNKFYEQNKEKIEEPPPLIVVERPPVVILEPVPVNYTENKPETKYQKNLELLRNQQGPSFSSKTSTSTNSQGETTEKTTITNNKTGETTKLTIPPPIIAPTPTEKPQRTTNITQNQTPPATCRTGCTGAILDSLDGVAAKQLATNNALQLGDLALLGVINNKLGPQLPNGISGFFKKAWESTALDKAINALNLFLTLHNAAMLSRNLAESIDVLIGNALSLVGIKNHEGNPIDFSAILGKASTSYLKSLIGEETYNGINTNWKKLSTIYQSAVNILDNLQNIYAGMTEAIETGAKYTGKIGNALLRARVVADNAYDEMSEDISARTGRLGQIQKVIDGIQTAQEVTDDLTNITENIQGVTESVGQITTEINTIKTAIKQGEDDKKLENDEAKEASQSPNISESDLIKPSED